MVDARGSGDESLVIDDAVGKLAANNVGVCRQLLEGCWGDIEVVRDAWVVVTVLAC